MNKRYTFRWSKKAVRQVLKNIEDAGTGAQCWFQAPHHGGCLQTCSKYDETFEPRNVYAGRTGGYESFCKTGRQIAFDILEYPAIVKMLKDGRGFVVALTTQDNNKFNVKVSTP